MPSKKEPVEVLTENALVMRRAYYKAWRYKHKDRVQKYNRTYWEKKARQAEKAETSKQ